MRNSETIWQLVDAKRQPFEALSDRVWGMPEIAYTEYRSVAEHTAMLKEQGFRVTENVAGIPTAVMGEAGEGGPVIAFLGEYDALPGLSQEANIAEPRPVEGGGHGHGCGHNMLGSAALLAATALKDWLAETGAPGGCAISAARRKRAAQRRPSWFVPAPSTMSMSPSPGTRRRSTRVDEALSLANTHIDFHLTGRASHAAAAPHLGRSALDAVELMNVGVNYMREHMPIRCPHPLCHARLRRYRAERRAGYAKVRYHPRPRPRGHAGTDRAGEEDRQGAALMTETKV